MRATLYGLRHQLAYGTLGFLLLLGACRPAPMPDRPPVIRFGYDTCDYCRMLIDEPRYAAAMRTSDGQARRFDDIGCLLHYLHEHPEATNAYLWVHDYRQERWIQASEAFFVQSDRLLTPMGYGIVAVSDQATADSLARHLNGTLVRFEALRAAPPPDPIR